MQNPKGLERSQAAVSIAGDFTLFGREGDAMTPSLSLRPAKGLRVSSPAQQIGRAARRRKTRRQAGNAP
jgi:hypothetical protein